MKIKYLSVLPIITVLVLAGFSLAHAQSDVFTQSLYYGLQGNSQVTQLQEFLTSQNLYSGPITGNYYFLTLGAVKAFQTQQGITPAAGYFGPMTMAAANKIADSEVGASNNQAISETGTSTPSIAPASSTTQFQLQALLQKVALLEKQLQAQQSGIQQQSQTLQQIAQNTIPPVVTVPTPTPTQSQGSTPTPTASITVNGSANAINIPYNTAATISWHSTNANSCSVSPTGWSGISSNQSTGNLTASQTYTVSCSGAGGSVSAGVTVNVAAMPPTTPSSACTPNWQCNNWSSCANSQQARTCSDSNNCNTTGGEPTLTQSCSIPPPTPTPAPTCTLNVSPASITAGQSAMLTWSSVNAQSGSISNIGNVNLSGSQNVNPAQTTTYAGSFIGQNNQTVNCQTTVTINQPQPIAWWSFDNQNDVTNGLISDQEGTYNAQNINAVWTSNGDGNSGGVTFNGHAGNGLGLNDASAIGFKVNNMPAFSQITLAFQMKSNGSTTADGPTYIAINNSFNISYLNGTFGIGMPSGSLQQSVSVDSTYPSYAVTYDGQDTMLFMDGQRVGVSIAGNTGTIAAGQWDFGYIPSGYGTLTNQVTVDNVKIYNQVLSNAQIQSLN
jgi:hypothetical protein